MPHRRNVRQLSALRQSVLPPADRVEEGIRFHVHCLGAVVINGLRRWSQVMKISVEPMILPALTIVGFAATV